MTRRKSTKKHHKSPPVRAAVRRGRRIPGLFLLGLVGALVVFGFVVQHVGYDADTGQWFTQDDAYISFRYARNALSGEGLVFNPGERVEGYTNFLWIIWLILAGAMGIEFSLAARVLGILAAGGMILFAADLARRAWAETGNKNGYLIGVAAAVTVACNGSVAYWAVSGLETAWFGLCVTASLWWWLRRSSLVILGLSLATLSRPEGGLIWLLLVGGEWLSGGGWRRAVALLIPVGLLLAPFGFFKLAYYGSLFPNPFYAKTGFAWEYFVSGFEYIWLYIRHYGLWGLGPLLVIVSLFSLKGRARVLPLVWCIYALYIVSVGGDVLRPHRFFVPITVAMTVGIVGGLGGIMRRLSQVKLRHWITTAVLVGFSIWSLIIPQALIASTRRLEIGLLSKMGFLAQSLRRVDPRPFTIAASTIGRISYGLPGRRVIDMLGLTDSTIARHPETIPGNVSSWRERSFNISYLLSQDPDYILFSTGHKPSAPAERALMLHEKYRRNYYTILFPSSQRNLAVHKRRGGYDGTDAVWPSIALAQDINRAFNFQMAGQYDSSMAVFRHIKETGPGDFALPDAFIADIMRRNQRYHEALAYADSAIAIDSMSIVAWQVKGGVAQLRGDTAAAAVATRQVRRICPWIRIQW